MRSFVRLPQMECKSVVRARPMAAQLTFIRLFSAVNVHVVVKDLFREIVESADLALEKQRRVQLHA